MKSSVILKPNYVATTLRPAKDVTYLVISDVHLFHRKTSTKFIIANLDLMFENYTPTAALAKVDAIFIAGDLFHTLATIDEEVIAFCAWLYRLFDFCVRHDIIVRFMEGTPGHDYRQYKLAEALAQKYATTLDFKYVDELSIELNPKLGLSILYVPDEWKGSTQKAQQDVELHMQEMSLKKVDIAIMHGLFNFQVPEQKKQHLKFDEEFFLNRVNYFINIGHDHNPKVNGRIIVQGSFDRTAQGEEHRKGACICYLRKDAESGYTLIENKNAKIYKTIKVRFLELEKALAYTRKQLLELPNDSYVVIKAALGNPILQNIDLLKREFMFLYIEKDTLTENDVPKPKLHSLLQGKDYEPIYIHKENICDKLITAISEKNHITDTQKHSLRNILEKLK